MDIIFIRELRVETVIGIHDWERQIKQIVVLDLELGTDIRRAAGSDHIDDTLSYSDIADRLTAFISASQFQLVETLAEQVAAILRDEFRVPWLRLTVSKPGAVSNARAVGVSIERGVRA